MYLQVTSIKARMNGSGRFFYYYISDLLKAYTIFLYFRDIQKYFEIVFIKKR